MGTGSTLWRCGLGTNDLTLADVQIKGLAKTFGGSPILHDIDLAVPAGKLVAILGASGSGKTTLLRLIGGFERADAGVIEIGGVAVCKPGLHVPAARRNIGYVAQEGSLFPHLSVAANVTFGLPRSSRKSLRKSEELLEMVGLPASFARRSPHELSGGEQQRVALARALAPAPRLILLDEPFSALDAALRVETRQAVIAALAEAKATALLVTHDQSEALSMGQEIAVLRQGRFVQVATPELLYRKPVDPELAKFVGEAVLLPGVVDVDHVICALGRLRLAERLSKGNVEVMVRPEQIRILPSSKSGIVKASVLGVTYYGHDADLRLLLSGVDEPIVARISARALPQAGSEVGLWVEGTVMAYATRRGV